MKLYFNGFSLTNEEELFSTYIEKSDFVVSGFSYGGIKALQYVLGTENRVDKLQLFSPAYFNDKDKKYKRMQLMYFRKDASTYCDNFLKNSGFPQGKMSRYFKMGTDKELEELELNHPIFREIYNFPEGLPKIHEHDGKRPQALGIIHENRLVVLFTFESDLGDGWENPEIHNDPEEVRSKALKMGANIIKYAFEN